MDKEIGLLLITALSIGSFHTLIGPDHYLPFIMISRAQQWTYKKTLAVTLLCGLGHVLSSILIGFLGITAGLAIGKVKGWEGFRGDIAAFLLLGFGLAYMFWGIKTAGRGKLHSHDHLHYDGTSHEHEHAHANIHSHIHEGRKTTFWWLFIIFVLGPCEPLIPILMYPAARHNTGGVILVASVFGLTTMLTMALLVSLAYFGMKQLRFQFLERYANALAGLVIALSGVAIILGL